METTEQPIREEAPARTSLARLRELLTKDEYLRLKAEGKTDRDIISELGTHPASFYALKQEWGLVGQAAPSAPKSPTKEKPASPAPTLEEALRGVACPVPDQWINELAKDVKLLTASLTEVRKQVAVLEQSLVGFSACKLPDRMGVAEGKIRELTDYIVGLHLENFTALVNEIDERLQDLENEYRHHRHQTGAGKWSGKAET